MVSSKNMFGTPNGHGFAYKVIFKVDDTGFHASGVNITQYVPTDHPGTPRNCWVDSKDSPGLLLSGGIV